MAAVNLNRITLVLAFIGVFIAGVLSVGHLQGKVPPCGLRHSCDEVLTSSYATPLGIPLAYVGLVAYAFLAALAITRAMKGVGNSKGLIYAGYGLAVVGTIGSLALTYISVTVLHSVCMWCLGSAATMTLTLIAYALLAQVDVAPETDRRPAFIFDAGLVAVLFFASLMGVVFIEQNPPNMTGPVVVDPAKANVELVPADAHIHGNPQAPITIIEFADLLCPSCKDSYPKVQEMVDTSNGKIRSIYRHFPLQTLADHKMSLPAANIAEIAADRGKFWDFVSAMYHHENRDLQTPDAIYAVARSVGLDLNEIQKRLGDVDDPAFKRTMRDVNAAGALALNETPTFLIIAPGMKMRTATAASLPVLLESPEIQKIVRGP